MHRYCLTASAWADARASIEQSAKAQDATESARREGAEGTERPTVPVGLIDLEPTVGWPLVIGPPAFAGNVLWGTGDAASVFAFMESPAPHARYHNRAGTANPYRGASCAWNSVCSGTCGYSNLLCFQRCRN